jgi:MFS family permease
VGGLEGFVEAVSSILKLASGYYSDRWQRKEPFVLIGYCVSNFVRPLIAFSLSPIHVFFVRVVDRLGKGIRTAPRDAWLASYATEQNRGSIFGFHRAMDNAGASVAPLLTALFLFIYPGNYRFLFFLAIIPGIASLWFVWKAVQLTQNQATQIENAMEKKERIEFREIKELPSDFKKFLLILFIFTLGLSTDAFLILRLHEVGISPLLTTVVWAAHNAVRMISSFWGGKLSDRLGHRSAILFGWIFYTGVYFLFGYFDHPAFVVGLLLIYGIYYGLTESAEKALVVEMVPARLHGSALGLYHLILGMGAIPAGLLFGTLWKFFGASQAFLISSSISGFSVLLFGKIISRKSV